MYDKTEVTIQTKAAAFYKNLLFLYPSTYRKQFGEQMLLVFHDMYQDELSVKGNVQFGFWLSIILDVTKSSITQHISAMKQQGWRKYFHITIYNIIGGILLLPFLLIFIYGMIGRTIQGDVYHYNRPFESVLYHSFIYANYFGKPLILMAIAILFPAIALLINLISIISSLTKTKKQSPIKLFLANPVAYVITLTGLFFLLIIFGHDFVPCTVNALMKYGFGQVGHIVSVFRNA